MAHPMAEKIPGLSDPQLASLLANAERLSADGPPKQVNAAKELLPLLHAETSARSEAAAARRRERVPVRKRKAAAPAPEPAAADSED